MLADIEREVRTIELMSVAGGSRTPATLTLWTESPSEAGKVELLLETEQATYSVIDYDFWKALVGLREMLEQNGLRPVVYGASRNVNPSNKSLEMGFGMHAYRLTLGKLATRDDLFHIFDTEPAVEPVTLEEQQEFARQWFDSLKPAEG